MSHSTTNLVQLSTLHSGEVLGRTLDGELEACDSTVPVVCRQHTKVRSEGRPNHSHDNKRSNGETKEGMLPVALKQSCDYEGMLFATKESENALAPAAFTPLVNSKSVCSTGKITVCLRS